MGFNDHLADDQPKAGSFLFGSLTAGALLVFLKKICDLVRRKYPGRYPAPELRFCLGYLVVHKAELSRPAAVNFIALLIKLFKI